jgi:CO dehydrogenase/acetyl-CoA synthase gamma subunit (corrinoid Fe-S protein)
MRLIQTGGAMLKANLYVDRIEIAPYLTPEECQGLGGPDCTQVAARLKNGSLAPEDCRTLSPAKRYALSLAVRALEVLPVVQSLELPRPVPPDLYEINEPGPESPLLVTGNSEFTLAVVTGLLALTVSPFYLLVVDTRGDTVDMSMVYRSFTPQRLDQGLTTHRLAERIKNQQLIIPGVVGPLKEELAAYTGWDIRVGPICVAELPLFLGEDAWQPPEES